jgi:hypothetical protein
MRYFVTAQKINKLDHTLQQRRGYSVQAYVKLNSGVPLGVIKLQELVNPLKYFTFTLSVVDPHSYLNFQNIYGLKGVSNNSNTGNEQIYYVHFYVLTQLMEPYIKSLSAHVLNTGKIRIPHPPYDCCLYQ